MKEIKLTKGKVAIVDDDMYEYLNQWKWFYNATYAVRGFPKRILMHRIIMNCPDNKEIDHLNRNKLDNRRCNLRIVTRSQNQHNTNLRKDNMSGHRGVFWNPINKNWRVQLSINKRRKEVGSFNSLDIAISAYIKAKGNYYEI